MITRRPIVVSTVSLVTLLLAACGGSNGTTGTTVPVDATTATSVASPGPTEQTMGDSVDNGGSVEIDVCGVLSEQEVADVLGAPGAPEPWDIPPSFHACTWAASEEVFVYASITAHPDPEVAATTFENWMTSNEFTEVSGIGDLAYTGSEITINVLSGIYEVEVDTSPEDLEASKHLASLILDRLP